MVIRKYVSSESKFITIDGLKVHYRDQGRGPVILCLHGICSSLHTWDGWVNALQGKYRVIRLDLPGFALTGPANFPYSIDEYTKFLKKFIDALGLQKVNMAGNSLGGYLTWNFAVSHPDRIDRIILLDPAGYPMKVPGPVSLFTTPLIGDIGVVATPKSIFDKYVKEVYGDQKRIMPGTIDRYYEILMYDGNRKACQAVFNELKKLANSEPAGITTIKAPTLIMWGGKDIWIPLDILERFKKDMPRAKVIVYDGVGHVPMEEIPEITAKDADLFLGSR